MPSHPLLAHIDQIIANHNWTATAAALQADLLDLREQTETFIRDYAELQALLDEARSDKRKLESKIWLQRLMFLLSKLLSYFDHHP